MKQRIPLAFVAVVAILPSWLAAQTDTARARELYSRGHLAFAQKEYTAAIARWEEALALDPALWEAHYQIAEALLATGRPGPAVPRLQEALRLHPGDARMTQALTRAEQMAAQAQASAPKDAQGRGPVPSPKPDGTKTTEASDPASPERQWQKLVESANSRVRDRTAGRGAYVLQGAPPSAETETDTARSDTPPPRTGPAARASGSVLDEMRLKAEAFAPRLRALSGQADQVDGRFETYLSSCYARRAPSGGATGREAPSASPPRRAGGREWFVVWEEGSPLAWQGAWAWDAGMSSVDAEYCQTLWNDIGTVAAGIRGGVEAIEAEAKALDIWPGITRELRVSHRLYWE